MTSGDWMVLAIVTACALVASRVLDIILTDKEQSENKGEQVGKYYVTYETDLMRALLNLTPLDLCDLKPLPRGPYHSNWRVLHVDGFEGGKTIQFYYPVKYEFKMGVVPPRAQ